MDGPAICIDTLPPDFFEWVIDMDAAAKEVDISKEKADWNKSSIYRVTKFDFAKRHNPNAFTPQVISFGPFHHGSEHLKATEEAKHRALKHVLHRAGKRSEPFGLDKEWKENPYEFLKMMLLDGCFMIEVLRINERSNDYATNDPVFSSRMNPLRKPYIKRDMLLLENQLPLLVLKALLESNQFWETFLSFTDEEQINLDVEYINGLVLSYCGKNLKANLSTLANHPLELYRMSLLHEDLPPINEANGTHTYLIENAVELWENGVHFRCKDTGHVSLRDINFDSQTGTLELPVLPVHDGTECLLLNMVAYEQIHVGTGNDITSYVMFMDALINTADDVELFKMKKIIIDSLASHKHVADLFNKLSKEAAHDAPNDMFNNVRYQLRNYYKKRRNKWRASLRRQYFQYLLNPLKL
ncbi:UPF0481 protein At3g47200-like [Carex rostrata]